MEEVKEVKEGKEVRETKVNKIPDTGQGAGICSKEQWQTIASTKKPQDKDHSFSDRSNLFKHMNKQWTSENPNIAEFQFSEVYACDKCDAVFINNTLLQDHGSELHIDSWEIHESNDIQGIKPQQFHCALDGSTSTSCDFHCETREDLKQHIEGKPPTVFYLQY